MYYCYVYLLPIFFHIFSVEGCERSLEVRGVEDYCWTKNVEVFDRLEYTGKTFLNFAKAKLGMEVETNQEPHKCEYYNCIFQELKMLNADGYPCHAKTTKWIKNNVIYNHAIILLDRADACSAGLSKSLNSKTSFSGDLLEEVSPNNDDSIAKETNQTKCQIVGEYMKCMAIVEPNKDCPVFQYP